MKTDPWGELPVPSVVGELSARRADEHARAGFFWARDAARNFLLLLQFDGDFPRTVRIPKLKGLKIEATAEGQLVFQLEDADQRDIFAELCRDIVAAAGSAENDDAAIRTAVARTWRWYHLLKGGASPLLSEEAQKGLLGELQTIELVAQRLDPGMAVEFWTGPEGLPKDFQFPGGCSIESKALHGTEQPLIRISSEWQLDTPEGEDLFLVVSDIARAVESDPDALTLKHVVDRVRQMLFDHSPSVVALFDAKLFMVGYRPEDDYSEYWWVPRGQTVFAVTAGFPRIEGGSLNPGVAKVTYAIEMAACRPFAIAIDDLLSRLEVSDVDRD